jgi:hypothetical protein
LVDGGLNVIGFLDEFYPVMHGAGKEVEDEFSSRDHCAFIDFERKNLVQVVRVELFVLILVPYPYLSIAALHLSLLLLLFGFLLLIIYSCDL